MTRIPSGITDQGFYFVALSSADLATLVTGLSSFTIYRSRNGAAEVQMTTPTVTEIDATNMPGVYFLLCDEDMTIAAGNETEEMAYRITASGMYPVIKTIELYDNAAWIVEGGFDLREVMRVVAAALGGKVSGAGTTTITIRNLSDTKDVVVATVDSDGNRSAVTLDVT